MSLRDTQLAELARDMGSDGVERLAGDAPNKIREAVCAFANDLPGHRKPGVVIIGMTDDGRPAGTPIDDLLLQSLADMRDDGSILPLPTMVVEKRAIDGHEYAVIQVLPSDAPPVRVRGRIWIRVGPRRALASAQDERILNERRRYHDQPYDLRPVHAAKISDLRRGLFDDYLQKAFAPDVLAANERTFEERLMSLRLLDPETNVPTVVGVLLLAHRPRDFLPGAYVQFRRVQGVAITDPTIDARQIDGPLERLFHDLDSELRAHNRIAVDFTSGPLEVRIADYPPVALAQIARNAIMHRTYEGTNAPVRITWFDDRVEITSPGGPFGTVTIQTFGRPGYADYRNAALAEAMRTLDLVQRFGVGIPSAQQALAQNGNPPLSWEVHDNLVIVTLRKRTA